MYIFVYTTSAQKEWMIVKNNDKTFGCFWWFSYFLQISYGILAIASLGFGALKWGIGQKEPKTGSRLKLENIK